MSYYTDYSNCTDGHEVDEETRTILNQGSWPSAGSVAGITHREMNYDSSLTRSDVASRCCTIQKNKHHSPSLEGE